MLIRLGSVLMNPDQVAAVERRGEVTHVFTTATAPLVVGGVPGELVLGGLDGEAAWKWFQKQVAGRGSEAKAWII